MNLLSKMVLFSALTISSLSFAASVSNLEEISFESNKIASDGPKTTITFKKDSDKTYTVNLHSITYSMVSPTPSIRSEILGLGLFCEVTYKRDQDEVKKIVCKKDQRAVDGGLTEVIIKSERNSTYSISTHTNYYAMLRGEVVDEKKEVGAGFRLLKSSEQN